MTEAVNENNKQILKKSFMIYTWIIVAFALVNIARIGFSGFAAGKANVWEQTNILYIISLYGAYPAFAYGIHSHTKSIWIPCLLIELTIFFAGSRAFATTLAIIFLIERGSDMWRKHKKNYKLFLLGAIAILFLLLYRMVDQQIMSGDLAGVLNSLSQPETWSQALEFNEPRVIIANYDYVVTNDFHLPLGDSLYRIIDFIPGATSAFPINLQYPVYFSDFLQEQVHAVRGVGGTIWGESYAMFGVIGVIIFTLIWLLFLRRCNKHLDYHSGISFFLIALGAYLSWYINRLDFNLVGQACKVMLLCFFIWVVIYLILGGEIKIHKISLRLFRRDDR